MPLREPARNSANRASPQQEISMQRLCLSFSMLVFAFGSGGSSLFAQARNQRAALELFEKKIRPALIEHCYECHSVGSDDIGGELLVDSRTALLTGGETGPAIVAGKPRDSILIRAMEYTDLEMPPDEKLPDSVIADFRRWIALGAPDPRVEPKGTDSQNGAAAPSEQTKVDLWSLQSVSDVSPPPVDDHRWPLTDVDRFVLSRLEQQGLQPNRDADPITLVRRVHFDLVGLPPSPQQVAAFVADPAPRHFEQIVDRLLASAQFGERWGRHWLDIARYGESAGSSRDVLMLYAWRYRDYVIEAFNADMPFDRFITEQIAGDLLPAATEEDRYRQTVATGLLAIGSKSLNGGNLKYDVIDDQIDVLSKAMLGLTVSCARCHDHKFDPIPTKDYYSLAGIFLSTETRYGGGTKRPKTAAEKRDLYLTLTGDVDPEVAKQRDEVAKKIVQLEKQINSSKKRVKSLQSKIPEEFHDQPDAEIPAATEPKLAKLIRQYQGSYWVLKRREADHKATIGLLGDEPDYAIGVRDAKKILDANILDRGEQKQPGELAERGFLSALGDSCEVDPIDSSESGRRQLAAWIVHPDNPLTARVAVNRIWQHLMGKGIVSTVDNFGVSGVRPSHPDLLDHLARRFVHEHKWSTKAMIRELVLSRTYRLSSEINTDAYQTDPDNRLRWRMTRRRLEAEPLRDAMLAVSGLLSLGRPSGSLVMAIGEGEVGRNIDTSVLDEPFDHRSVYLPIIRGIIPEQLRLFDFPEPSNVQGARDSNTTPTQSLFLMNARVTIRVAREFAGRLLRDPENYSDDDRIRSAHLLCFSTPPTDAQIQRDRRFIQRMMKRNEDEADHRRLAWTAYCQSLIASAKFRFID